MTEAIKNTPPAFSRDNLLRWLFLGRMSLAGGILLGALLSWFAAGTTLTLIATVLFLAATAITIVSVWWTRILGREPGENFLYAQVIFDGLLVTAIVHITGAGDSVFAPLYILVISVGALLLPLRGGVLVGVLATMLYFADTVWGGTLAVSGAVFLQMGLFGLVALATGLLGDRLRGAGIALGAAVSELQELRLTTGDILENISTGILTVGENGRLLFMNSAAQQLMGLDAEEWEGVPVLAAVQKVAPGLSALLQRTITQGMPLSRYKILARREDRELVLGVSTTVLERGEGGPPSVTAIFQDISELEKVEALNRRNERLEAIAELSASLAHEIKNPLASIRSAVEQLTASDLEPDDKRLLGGLVMRESSRLSRLLSEFIDFSRLRIGTVEELDLARLVHESTALVRQHPEAQDGVRIEEVGLDQSVSIQGDADLLHRAVFNLVLNAVQAVQAVGADGVVVVEIRTSGRDPWTPGIDMPSPVRLSVSDNGPGITPDVAARIFDPFYTTRSGGSGLGLAVVHRAVEAHSGAVFVDSGEGSGAEFVIFLPGQSKTAEMLATP